MWFAVRDIAFEHPVTDDQTQTHARSHGHPARRRRRRPRRSCGRRMLEARVVDDLDLSLEAMIRRMIGILLIEISAHHVFAWAEELLADPDLVAGDGDGARLVSYIRQDESPHVAYLATALTEMRDRTFIGESGRRIPGTRGHRPALGRRPGRLARRRAARASASCGSGRSRTRSTGIPRRDEILEGFHALGDPRARRGDGVKFGIFYEHQLPRPWEEDSEYRLIQDALEQIELADSLGIEYVWEVEHHFLEEYSHSSAPEVFLAAASQRTKNMRLGHGIVQTPGAVQPPGAGRRAALDARSRLGRARRLRHRRVVVRGRARRVHGRPDREARALGGRAAGRAAVHDRDAVHRPPRQVGHAAAAQRRAEAAPEAAPAGVGGVQPARHDPARRTEGDRRARVRVRRPGGGAPVGRRLRPDARRRRACRSATRSTRRSRA